MKTTEEKARAYDKVRKKIAIRFGSNVADEFFAEFEESEDEKVRKEIVNYFQCQSEEEPTRKEIHNKWIAWLENIPYTIDHEKREGFHLGYKAGLEKQGEQNPADKIEEAMQEVEEKAKVFSESHKGENSEQILAEMRGEQKPQRMISAEAKEAMYDKPADTVEPKFKVGDKIYLKPEYRMPNDDTPIANTVKEIRRIDDKHYRFDGSYIFIEDQDKYELVEQKPEENKGNIGGVSANSEWCEEDERLCQCLIEEQEKSLDAVRNCKYGHSEIISDLKEMYHERRDWLKSIKDRILPKQEWSEEDEQHIDSLLKRLDALCRNKFERTRFAISEDRDWLKSLRPQNRWKPSELQLGCLSDAIEYYNSSGYPATKLKELYEQLKKL